MSHIRHRPALGGLFAPTGPLGDLGQTELVRMGPNSWAVSGPLGEVGQVLDEARQHGKVHADPAQPMPGGLVLVNFRVTPIRTPPPARAGAAAFSPRATARTAAPAPERAALPAPHRRRVPRWAWWTAAAAVPVGAVMAAAWWLWVHMDGIVAGASSAAAAAGRLLLGLFGLAVVVVIVRALLGGGGRSGTWKTND